VSEWMDELVGEWKIDWVGGRVNGWMGEWMDLWVSGRVKVFI